MRRLLSLVALAAALVGAPAGWASAAGDPARDKQWGLDRIGAEAAWRVADGSGVVVAVVDSGIDAGHEDLAGQLVPGWDFVQDDAEPQDEFGHGTHVAGIIAAAAGNGKGVAGVAPGAKIMPIRVLDASGAGTLDDVVAGVRWAVDHGADVINLSLGEDTQALLGPSFGDVVDQAWAAGAVPVVAAGNQLVTDSGFRDERALVVSATNRDDGKPTYSSGTGSARWGIAAPGGELPQLGAERAVLSTYWNGKEPNRYAFLAGTSQAAPHVAGAVAVLLSTGRFSQQQAVERLLATAKDIGSPGPDGVFGAGRLDLAAAVSGVGSASSGGPAPAPQPAPSPAPPARPTTTTVAPFTPPPADAPTTTTTEAEAADEEEGAEVAAPRRRARVLPTIDDDGGGGAGREVGVAAGIAAALAAGTGAAAAIVRRRA